MALKSIHFGPHGVLLLEHLISHLVQGFVKDLKDVLHFLLVIVKLIDECLFLLIVEHFQLD